MTLRAGAEIVSHSELAYFRECPRKHHFAYVLRRTPVIEPAYFKVGRRFDLALRGHHTGEPIETVTRGMPPEERALMRAYAAYWGTPDRLFDVERVGLTFQVAVGRIIVKGELDAAGTRRDTGKRVVIENKTTSEDIAPGSAYWRQAMNVDPQATVYLYAAKSKGWALQEVTRNALRKPALRKGAKESEEDFEQRVLEDIGERPEHYFQRQTVIRLEHEHEAFVRDLEGIVHLMVASRELREPPRNVDACRPKFRSPCAYVDVCEGAVSLQDGSRFTSDGRGGSPEAPTPPREREVKFEF